jgi:hypothetical protein
VEGKESFKADARGSEVKYVNCTTWPQKRCQCGTLVRKAMKPRVPWKHAIYEWLNNHRLLEEVPEQSKARNVFARSNIGIMGSNPTRGMDVCVYSAFVLSCVGSNLMSG